MADLDVLTRRWTAFTTWGALLVGGETREGKPLETSYRPTIHPDPYDTAAEIAERRELADAYDAAQAQRGDARRCHRGSPEWWTPAGPPAAARPRRRKVRALPALRDRLHGALAQRGLHDARGLLPVRSGLRGSLLGRQPALPLGGAT